MEQPEEEKQELLNESVNPPLNNVKNDVPESAQLGNEKELNELKLNLPQTEPKKVEQVQQINTVPKKKLNSKQKRKKKNICHKYFNKTCLHLYLGCMPPVSGNNVALGICNMIFCGCGLILTPFCDNSQSKAVLCCAGLFQLLTAFCGVGILFAFMTSLAFCCEDNYW